MIIKNQWIYIEVDEDDIDEHQFKEEDYDGHDNDKIEEIKEEDDNSNYFVKHHCVMKLTLMLFFLFLLY